MSLCSDCDAITFEGLLTRCISPWKGTFLDLRQSASSCELCAIFLESGSNETPAEDDDLLYIGGICNDGSGDETYWTRSRLSAVRLYAGSRSQLEDWDGVSFTTDSVVARIQPTMTFRDGRLDRECGELHAMCRSGLHTSLDSDKHADIHTDTDCEDVKDKIEWRFVEQPDDVGAIKRWSTLCDESHVFCSSLRSRSKEMPTRLVEIDDASHDLQLVDVIPLVVPYSALSHRWGGKNTLRTTTVSIAEHKKRIKLCSLSRTFQDAVEMTKKLGIRHIWIDSLCIIQDSATDWAYEASRMAAVYQNAHVTLAAACAENGDGGLFHSRQDRKSVKKTLRLTSSSVHYPWYLTSSIDHPSNFVAETDGSILGSRAWCLQKRSLSTRTIHFGRTQLLWECQEMAGEEACHALRRKYSQERFGKDEANGFLYHIALSDWPRQALPSYRSDVLDGYSLWYHIVRAYSRRAMTVLDDKLPAISGMASVFARWSKDSYFAGLWKWDLGRGLLWFGKDLAAPPNYRAPTWSWAAWDGPIQNPLLMGHLVIKNIEPSVALATNDPFGRISSAQLKLTGSVTAVKLGEWLRDQRGSGHTVGWTMRDITLLNAHDEVIGAAVLDKPLKSMLSASLSCLMVLQTEFKFQPYVPQVLNESRDTAWALVLEQTQAVGIARRAGLARVYSKFFPSVKSDIVLI